MTSQTVTVVAGNNTFSKIFTISATDDSWGNVLLDTISSQPIGILLPNQVVNNMQANYAAGLGAFRLINSQSLKVSVQGLMSKTGLNNYQETQIPSTRINPNDILETYPMAVDSTSGDTAVLAFVNTTKGELLYKVTTSADNTPAEIVTAVNGLSLGSDAFGATLTKLQIQCEDGSRLASATVVDNMGGIIATFYGSERGATAGSRSNIYNGLFENLNIPIERGYALKVSTVTG